LLRWSLGAGKSTLIKLLVDYEGRAKNISGHENFPSPVMGLSEDPSPTSGDVHLYADPGTYYTREPILYADCEGMDTGEVVPRGAMFKYAIPGPSPNQISTPHETTKSTGGRPAHREMSSSSKESVRGAIHWAASPKKNTRDFVVQKLYSRILYAFSDIIVFVVRNQRYVGSVQKVVL
jgi:hypothetical protein